MKIVYDDIIYCLQRAGGITTYWNELHKLIKNILTINGSKRSRYFPVKYNSKDTFIFHSSYYRWCNNKNSINITTVHDFTYEYFRRDFKSILHKIQKKVAVKKAKGVICVSENTKKDLLKFYPWYQGKIKVIYHGYSSEYKYENLLRENKLIFVGSRTLYKNFDLAVEIVYQLNNYKLIIVDGGQLNKNEIKLLEKLNGRFQKINFVSNNELSKLYNSSKGLLYTSEYEGFGIPALESQACGCVVICQKKSSLPEVVQDSAIFINKNDINQSCKYISNILDNKNNYSKYMKLGFDNIKRFSWDKCAEETLAFYNDVYNEWVKNENLNNNNLLQ